MRSEGHAHTGWKGLEPLLPWNGDEDYVPGAYVGVRRRYVGLTHSEGVDVPAGVPMHFPAVEHETENIGDSEGVVLLVELK